MPVFAYKAKSGPGRAVEGVVEAENRAAAVEKLSKSGCFPIRLEEKKGDGAGGRSFGRCISVKELTLFTRQFSDLLESGVPLMRALAVARRQTESARLAGVLGEVVSDVESGKALSGALAARPGIFPPLYTNLVRAGEAAGMLGTALGRLADFTEREEELRSKLVSAMIYPALVAFVGAGTVVFLVVFVVPRLAGMFTETGQALPLMTRGLLALSTLLTGHAGLIVAALTGLALAVRAKWEAVRAFSFRASLRIPVWGDAVRKVSVARFSRTLSTLLAGGVPILDALTVAAHVLDHPILRDQILEAAKEVRDGSSLADSLARAPDFPDFIRHMIAVGEEGNILEKSLQKAAATYERESDRAIKTVSSLLEPVLILGVGAAIGSIVIALLLPIFEISAFVK